MKNILIIIIGILMFFGSFFLIGGWLMIIHVLQFLGAWAGFLLIVIGVVNIFLKKIKESE